MLLIGPASAIYMHQRAVQWLAQTHQASEMTVEHHGVC